MSELWDKVTALSEVDTGKAQPMFHTYPVINIFREDKREEALPREEKKFSGKPEGHIYAVTDTDAEVRKRLICAGAEPEDGEERSIECSKDFAVGLEGDGLFTKQCSRNAFVLKPTACLVSRYGMDVTLPSLNQVAFAAKKTDVLAEILEAAAGVDERDPWTRDAYGYDFTTDPEEGLAGLKIAVPAGEALSDNNRKDMLAHCFGTDGWTETELTWQEYYDTVYNMVYSVECALERESERKENFDTGMDLMQQENYENYYLKALKIKALIKEELDLLLREYDAVCVPEQFECFVQAAHLTGLPFLKCKGDGPLLIAGANQEKKLLQMGKALEQKWEERE